MRYLGNDGQRRHCEYGFGPAASGGGSIRIVAICLLVFMLPLCTAAVHAQAKGETSPGNDAPHADKDELRALFEEGNAFYEDGDFISAIDAYGSLVARGVEDKDLYYNLASAHFKNGELGRAILYYERALRLAPRDEDTQANLSLVEAMLRDRQFIRRENGLKRALVWINRSLTVREAVLLSSSLYLLFCLFAVIFILRKSHFVRGMYRRLSILSPGRFLGLSREADLFLAAAISFCLLAGSAASAYHKVNEERARDRSVVVEPEAAVYSGPREDTTLQFKIHEGTRVRIRTRQPRWVQVELPGDLSGWIEADAVEEI